MGKIHVIINDELEKELRRRSPYKGDMSKITDEALRQYFHKQDFPIPLAVLRILVSKGAGLGNVNTRELLDWVGEVNDGKRD